MNEVIHLRIDDAVTADFIRSKAESQHTTPDGYVNSLVRKQVLEEEMNRPLTLITAAELAGRHGSLSGTTMRRMRSSKTRSALLRAC